MKHTLKETRNMVMINAHAMRREIEMNIDRDEDDPELEDYEEVYPEEKDNFSTSSYLV